MRHGQILKPGQQVVGVQLLDQNWSQANFEARPNEGTRPGFIVCPGHGAIKLRRAHSCSKSHFYTLYFLQKSLTFTLYISYKKVSLLHFIFPTKKSHFYTIYFLQKSETKMKSELVYVLWSGAWTSSLPTWDKNITCEQNISYCQLTSGEEQRIVNQLRMIRNFKVILYLNLMTSTYFFLHNLLLTT